MAKIRVIYARRMQANNVDMYLGSLKLSFTTPVSTLDRYDDKFIVLRAVLPGADPSANPTVPVTREPFQPVNAAFTPSKLVDMSDGTAKPLLTPNNERCPNPTTAPSRARYISPTQYAFGEFEAGDKHEDMFKRSCSPSSKCNSPYPAAPQIKREIPAFGRSSGSPVKKEEQPSWDNESLVSSSPQIQSIARSHSPAVPIQDVAPPAPLTAIPISAQNERLKGILTDGSPEILEAEVQRNIFLLEKFKYSLAQATSQSKEALQWLRQIETVLRQNTNEPTIIGVVGNTGAGKSSVINAMLDEERLVPTNCMRACTAVVTELSWNPSNNENAKYRAEIEFIKPEDWEKELRILFEELLDGSGKVSRDATNEDSEAGIAYAKIKAVYPKFTRDEIANASVRELMRHPSVKNVLGTTKTVEQAHPNRFYRVLQSYVDSKEKLTGDKKQAKEMEYWPLIKVVKIYTKADALSTGAKVVDLPGVHDSNAGTF
jgi:Dynamin family